MLWQTKVFNQGSRFCVACSTYTDEDVTLDSDVIKKMTNFPYLKNVLSSGRKQEVVQEE